MVKFIFDILCVFVILAEAVSVHMITKANKEHFPTMLLNYCFADSAVTIASYAISINCNSYFLMSLANSIYFCSIDVLLVMVIELIAQLTASTEKPAYRLVRLMSRAYALFDCLVLLINPFHEFAIRYTPDPELAGHWIYHPYLLYNMHLAFCYLLIIDVVLNLLIKMFKTPQLYRSRYSLIVEGVFVIVVLNCLFLYAPVLSFLKYDISVLLYGVMLFVIYYNSIYYADRKLLKEAHSQILTEFNSPLILFDYEKKFVSSNNAAMKLFPEKPVEYSLDEFLTRYGMKEKIKVLSHPTTFHWAHEKQIYRCDYQTLVRKNEIIGYVFTFSEVSTEIDMLTGFHTIGAAARDFSNNQVQLPAGILVCDPAGLTLTNEKYGRSAGDRVISAAALLMRECCPEDAYFARLHDALMIAVCPSVTASKMQKIVENVMARGESETIDSEKLHIICAFSMCTASQPSVQEAVNSAENTIYLKKMMDGSSSRSSLLFSLARILKEAEPETEQHVQRTRALGEKIAKKMQLSDEMTANLILLCLVHDVGKVCIPTVILNKPTNLTVQEQEMVQSHVQKGYLIAKASRDLEPLADMILHHHERWDGAGYPGRLKKEEIPLLSRIIAIIDTYDSMTNDRPYHKAVSRHEALEELERCAGSQFDPYLVSEFAELIRQEEDYRNEKVNTAEGEDSMDSDPKENTDDALQASDNEFVHLAPVQFSRYSLSSDGEMIRFADEHFEAMTGYTQEDVATGGLTQSMLIFPEDKDPYERLKDKLLVKEKEAFIEHRLRMKDGSCRCVFCHGWPSYDPAVQEQRIQIIIMDMSGSVAVKDIKESEQQMAEHNQQLLKQQIRQDALTGLLNHNAFRNDFQEALLADNRICVMLMCDMDNFKEYNDTKGHAQGDELLKGFAKFLSENVGTNGLVCRMGGDEFAIGLFYPMNTERNVIVEDVRRRWTVLDHNLTALSRHMSVSMGMGFAAGKEKNFDQVYDEADRALYKAKELGKHRVVT